MAAGGLTSSDVGHRVVVRRKLIGQQGPSGGQAYTDVLGILEDWDAAAIRVRRSDDTLVEVATADIARAKRVPAPPTRRS